MRIKPKKPRGVDERTLRRILLQVAECRITPDLRGDVVLAINQARNALCIVWDEHDRVHRLDEKDEAPWRAKKTPRRA